jgi:hypothetical protein
MNSLEIYLRSTDKDGRLSITEHQVWDVNLFMEARQAEATKAGGKAAAERITREQYIAAIKPKASK